MTSAPRTVAIVGRPNVGKSSLFNRLAGKNISIVHDMAGVTRDRIMAECRRGPQIFDIMDTGGIGANTADVLTEQVQIEASIALEVADLLIFVVDIFDGITPIDQQLAQLLRRTSKPVVLVCNKADSAKRRLGGGEFTKFGFKQVYDVSAEHGLGIDALVAGVCETLGLKYIEPEEDEEIEAEAEDEADFDAAEEGEEDFDENSEPIAKPAPKPVKNYKKERPLKIAIVGRPNAGKSSLVNALLNEQRAIVSPVAGTTRDSLDIQCEIGGHKYQLIDTAGIRKAAKLDNDVELFSVQRAVKSIERADICLLVVDCAEGVKAQDRKIAKIILDTRKPCILVLNKFDLFHPEARPKDRLEELEETVRREFFFLHYAPLIPVSAKKRQNLDKLFKAVERVKDGAQRRIGTGPLNRLLHSAIEQNSGSVGNGKFNFKLLYATQVNDTEDRAIPVPHFILFANRATKLQDTYLRFLENRIRDEFPGEGLPFFLKVKGKEPKASR